MAKNCCITVQAVPACVMLADGTMVSVTYNQYYNKDNVVVAFAYVLPGTTAPYVPPAGAVINIGDCPTPIVDVEWTLMCEELADGTNKKFMRRAVTTTNPVTLVTAPTVVTDWQLDKVTSYSVVDENQVGLCDEDCPDFTPPAGGLVTDWSIFSSSK